MIFDALLATIGDLAVGLLAAFFLATMIFLIREELRSEKEQEKAELEAVPEIEEADIWAGLTPDRDQRVAEARFGSGREAA